jgi:hypothetical protein
MDNVWKSVIHVVESMVPGIIAAAADLKFTEEEIKNLSAKFAVEVLNETGKEMTETEAIKVFEAVLIIIKVAKS